MNWNERCEEQKALVARAMRGIRRIAECKEDSQEHGERIVFQESKLIITGIVNGGERRRITTLWTVHGRITIEYDEM